jgi:hypothetical protein
MPPGWRRSGGATVFSGSFLLSAAGQAAFFGQLFRRGSKDVRRIYQALGIISGAGFAGPNPVQHLIIAI